jgi:SSS family solute:Na+ symporter
MNENTPLLLTVFIFTFTPLVLAEVARKHSLPTVEDFFLQNRGMSMPLVFFTVYSTWVSSFAFLGATSYFYAKGPVYLTCFAWNALFAVMFFAIGERIWFYGRQNGYVSPVDFFSDIYRSKPLSMITALIMIVFTLPYLQIQLTGGAYLIDTATGGLIPWRLSGLLFYLIMIIYLWAGGLRAVALTDVYYGILMFAAMIISGIYLAHEAGGVSTLFRSLAEDDSDILALPGPGGTAGPSVWLCMFFIIPLGALMGPQMWIRFYAARRRKTFRLLPLLLCLATIEYIGPILAGAAGHILDPNIANSDMLLPTLLLRYAPRLLCGILFCGIAAAALSTANSQIHATAMIYTLEFHRRFISPGSSEKHLVAVGKWAVLLISACAYLLLIRAQAISIIVQTGTMALGGTAQLAVPTLGALFWKRSNSKGAVAGLLAGEGVLLLAPIFPSLDANYFAVAGLICNALIFLIAGNLLKTNPETRSKIVNYRRAYDKSK